MTDLGTSKPATSLIDYLALGEVPWSLAYVGFLAYFVAITTYIADVGAAAMVIALIGLFFGTRRPNWPAPVWTFFAFWICAAVTTALSGYPGDFEPVIELGKLVLIFLVAVNVLWNRHALRLFLLIYLACFTLFPVRGTLASYYIHDNADFGRPSWARLFGNANDMAALTLLALAVAAGFVHAESPRTVRIAALFLCLVFGVVILLTQSRAAFIASLVPPDHWFSGTPDEDEKDPDSDEDAVEDADAEAEVES